MSTVLSKQIDDLADELDRSGARSLTPRGLAAWLLARFVRREEAEARVAARDGRINELRKQRDAEQVNNACLRAELRGQRCDGSGKLFVVFASEGGLRNSFDCVGCPACKPDATPTVVPLACPTCSRGLCCGFGCGCACHEGDGGCARESVSTAEEQAAPPVATSGYQSAAPAPVEHVVKLHPETLRALVAALLMGGLFSLDNSDIEAYQLGGKIADHQWAAAFTVSAADALLAELNKETQP